MSSALELLALRGIPMVRAGDDIARLIIDALSDRGTKAAVATLTSAGQEKFAGTTTAKQAISLSR